MCESPAVPLDIRIEYRVPVYREVSMTLPLPASWGAYMMAFACGVVARMPWGHRVYPGQP